MGIVLKYSQIDQFEFKATPYYLGRDKTKKPNWLLKQLGF